MRVKLTSSSSLWKKSVMPYEDDASLMLSIFYGLFIVLLAMVFKVSEKTSTPLSVSVRQSNISKVYLCFLFFVALAWLIAFKIHRKWWRQNSNRWFKSPHASNKWLKAIVAIFGFSVVVKESLEVLAVNELHSDKCHDKPLLVIHSLLHAMFVVGEVLFLFFYAKIHIQGRVFMSRLAIMHVMSTNLAVWISIIADETDHALAFERFHHHHQSMEGVNEVLNQTKSQLIRWIQGSSCNSTLLQSVRSLSLPDIGKEPGEEGESGLFKGACFCHTLLCSVVSRADQILSPMLIEFCLVASCLLYVTWSNVGKKAKSHHVVTKPSYKFYKSYKGVMFGTLILLGCVVVMALLASVDSGIPDDLKNYVTEHRMLVIYDAYLTLCNSSILLACIACFYVFSIVPASKKKDSQAGLDVVLLFICLVGPLMVGLFSILAFAVGPLESKQPGWSVSLARSVSDIVVSVVQILLIVFGFFREPSNLPLSSPTKNLPKMQEKSTFDDVKSDMLDDTDQRHSGNDDSEDQQIELKELETNLADEEKKNEAPYNQSHLIGDDEVSLTPQDFSGPRIVVPQLSCNSRNSRTLNPFKLSTPPRKSRIILRDIIMFLVISNSCLWILLSLSETAFKIYPYQKEFFGHSAWTTLTSVTAPLSMFLKLHSAACLFEIWSYT